MSCYKWIFIFYVVIIVLFVFIHNIFWISNILVSEERDYHINAKFLSTAQVS